VPVEVKRGGRVWGAPPAMLLLSVSVVGRSLDGWPLPPLGAPLVLIIEAEADGSEAPPPPPLPPSATLRVLFSVVVLIVDAAAPAAAVNPRDGASVLGDGTVLGTPADIDEEDTGDGSAAGDGVVADSRGRAVPFRGARVGIVRGMPFATASVRSPPRGVGAADDVAEELATACIDLDEAGVLCALVVGTLGGCGIVASRCGPDAAAVAGDRPASLAEAFSFASCCCQTWLLLIPPCGARLSYCCFPSAPAPHVSVTPAS